MALGGRSVAEWKATISRPEFERWIEYYKRWPFDDMHRYHRPAALIGNTMSGRDTDAMLEWLQPTTHAHGQYTDADLNTMKAFGFKPPRG